MEKLNKQIEFLKEIEKFKIQVQIKEIKGEVWEEMFRAVSKIRSEERLNTCKTEIEKINERIKQLNVMSRVFAKRT